MRWILTLCLVALVSLSGTGCAGGQRVVLIPPITLDEQGNPTDLIRIGPNVSGRIYVLVEGKWELSANDILLPEGWFCAPVGGK